MKIVTMVLGRVLAGKSLDFERGYSSMKGGDLPPGLESSFLLRSTADPEVYAIQSIWSSREALDAMRNREKPRAVALFEQVGVSPRVEVHEVVETVP